jgi:hypothetical protein
MNYLQYNNTTYKFVFVGTLMEFSSEFMDLTTSEYEIYIDDETTGYFVRISKSKISNGKLFIQLYKHDDKNLPFCQFTTNSGKIDLKLFFEILNKTVFG